MGALLSDDLVSNSATSAEPFNAADARSDWRQRRIDTWGASARFAACVTFMCRLGPAPAWAEPLNLADPTPRNIQIEFEISVDPGRVGQTYSESFVGMCIPSAGFGLQTLLR